MEIVIFLEEKCLADLKKMATLMGNLLPLPHLHLPTEGIMMRHLAITHLTPRIFTNKPFTRGTNRSIN